MKLKYHWAYSWRYWNKSYVKVEGTSFTVSEPFSVLEIEPIIYTYATEEQKSILWEQFEVMPFPIKTIRLERIFTDKIFVAEFYYEREMYFDVAKHIYDVGVMLDLQPILDLLSNAGLFIEISGYKRLEETRRAGSDLADKKFSDFEIFRELYDSMGIREAYQNMQRNLMRLLNSQKSTLQNTTQYVIIISDISGNLEF